MGTWAEDSFTPTPDRAEYRLTARHNTIGLMSLNAVLRSDYADPMVFDGTDATQFLENVYDALVASGNFTNFTIARTYEPHHSATYTP